MRRRRRRRGPEKKEGLPPWMATFSDMVTLLLTFFVMMMAMANFEDNGRVEAVVESIRQALGAQGYSAERLPDLERALKEEIERDETVRPLEARLRESMDKHLSNEVIRITPQENALRLRLDDKVFFRPGSTELHPSAYAVLAELAALLAEEDVDVTVEGHTDRSGDETANWELSALRAVAVVEGLRSRGDIPGERLSAAAFGSTRPASNFSEADPWNRRIEFVLHTDEYGAADTLRRLSTGASDGRSN